jgi:site-specific DNA recombinase
VGTDADRATAAVFAQVQDLLAGRGEDHSPRTANACDYLLAGLIVCGLCGKRFVGTAATGNRYRYKYYTCFSHQRCGAETCHVERLSADEVDEAVLDALLSPTSASNSSRRRCRSWPGDGDP